MSITEFLEDLKSGDDVRCIKAVEQAIAIGPAAAREAAAVVADSNQRNTSRYWALQIVAHAQSSDPDFVLAVAAPALHDRYSGVRVVAIHILAALRPPHAVESIATLLNDQDIDPTWWTDPPSTVSAAAARALGEIGTPAAKRALETSDGA